MFLTNHTFTGIVLGLTIDEPALLAPVAVASHLVLDAVPHYGLKSAKGGQFRVPAFLVLGSVDFALSTAVTVGACLVWPQRIGHILVGVIGADLPDLTYIPLIVFGKRRMFRLVPGYGAMFAFLARIQWYEKPPGLIAEAIWAVFMLWLLNLLH